MNPLIEFYKKFTAKDYKWDGTEAETSAELGQGSTNEQRDELVEYIKADIAGEHNEPAN